MKITFITTVFNEERTVRQLLESVLRQTIYPDEVIVVDGGSTDKTVEKLEKFAALNRKLPIQVIVKKGNRSVGRNEAIKRARGEIIACSDAGCILDKNWLKLIIEPFKDTSVDVVAGYYKGRVQTIFQKALIPYVLVMEDKLNPNSFLPATRSIAFTKKIWEKMGGFSERYSHNEDYVFAKLLQRKKAKIIFVKEAVIEWLPRTTFTGAFYMFYRFALGDAEAGIWRPKVVFLFVRYLVVVGLLVIGLGGWFGILIVLGILGILYCAWAVQKNYAYVRDLQAFYLLPSLQLTADAAVILGTISGIIKRWVIQKRR